MSPRPSVINKDAFYPGASLGFVFSDAFGIQNDSFSYGKFRASIARVSNAPGAYKNSLNYTTFASYNGQSLSLIHISEPTRLELESRVQNDA